MFCASDILIKNSTAAETVSAEVGYGFELMCVSPGDPEAEAKWIVVKDSKAIGPNMRHGFIIQDHVHHSVIEGCLTEKNFFGAIELHASKEHHIEIANNVVRDSLGAGIKIRSGAGEFNWVHGNLIEGAKWGIQVETGNNTIEGNTFQNYTMEDAQTYGVYTSGETGLRILNNRIEGNDMPDNKEFKFTGMYLKGLKDSVIEGNIVEGNHRGVLLGGSTDFDPEKNTVRNNRVYDIDD